ncbi:pancreatic triacylglycerol lipase-like [Brevipalpus obovatus]|uniref:pancreatic triacylglycerol lipase-like n=1 Tax=Brevipalpus obovatus TaxID=246614 RepID=UPI003D9E3BB3
MFRLVFLVLFTLQSVHFSESAVNNNTILRLIETALPYIKFWRVQAFNPEQCVPELGCFRKNNDFYHPFWRPLSVVPEKREVIDTRFTLFTVDNLETPQNISANPESIIKSHYQPHWRTVFVIHGFYFDNFFGQYQQNAFKQLKEALFSEEKINMIFTDWGRGASTWYLQATANARIVGAEIALLANTLIEKFAAKPETMYIIGHSLGAHIAGYAGARIKNLGRITGLDPAKPYFDGMPLETRLDPTDAAFVDVIHTNSPTLIQPFGFGSRNIMGDIDYYPNNGNTQPGCIREKVEALTRIEFAYGLRKVSVCNHARSVWFLTESLRNKKCRMFAFRCSSDRMFRKGQCWKCGPKMDQCRVMGGYYPTGGSKLANFEGYYLLTNSEPPFCVHQYRVELIIDEPHECCRRNMLAFSVEMSDGSVQVTGKLGGTTLLQSDRSIAFIAIGIHEIKSVKTMHLQWSRITDKFGLNFDSSGNCTLVVDRVSVTPMNMWSDKLKEKLTIHYMKNKFHLPASHRYTLSFD